MEAIRYARLASPPRPGRRGRCRRAWWELWFTQARKLSRAAPSGRTPWTCSWGTPAGAVHGFPPVRGPDCPPQHQGSELAEAGPHSGCCVEHCLGGFPFRDRTGGRVSLPLSLCLQQVSDSNPPRKLVCGHVISKDVLTKVAQGPKPDRCSKCPLLSQLKAVQNCS